MDADVIRYFPCDGNCGGFIEVPAQFAHLFFDHNGRVRQGHELMYCEDCRAWFSLEVEDQPMLINFLPTPR
jgi:hypothetical protein